MELSMKNGWTDKDGRVFIYFTLEDARERLKCSTEKILPSMTGRRGRERVWERKGKDRIGLIDKSVILVLI